MKTKLLILISMCSLLVACNDDNKEAAPQQPAASTSETQRNALREFSTKSARKVETLEEYQARQKAEAGKK